jgi:hypothetical protein
MEASAAAAHRRFAQAASYLANPHARRCITQAFERLALQGALTVHSRVGPVKVRFTVGAVDIVPIPIEQPTEDAIGMSFAMTVTYSMSAHGRTRSLPIRMQMDTLAFRLGRAAVGVSTLGLGRACSPDREAQLFSLLLNRANTAVPHYPDIRPPLSGTPPGTSS